MVITISHAGRRLTVKVPKGTDEVSIEVPPPSGGRTSQESEKPLIILTDRI